MHVLVYEPDHSGHHFAYLSLLLPAVADVAGRVTLATRRAAAESGPFRLLIAPMSERIAVDASLTEPLGFDHRSALARADELVATVQRLRPDHLLVPYADGLGQALALRRLRLQPAWSRDLVSEALFMRASVAYPIESVARRIRARISWMLAERAPFTHKHHLDPVAHEWLASRSPRRAERWLRMPDPVEAAPPLELNVARRACGFAAGGRALGCAGLMNRRKGADLLIRAFARAALQPEDRLYLLGQHEDEITALLQRECAELVREGRIVSQDRFIPPAEIAQMLCAMDLVCTPYPRHIGSASIALRAAAAGRPVLGGTYGWIASIVPRFGLGWTCDVEDVAAFAAAIPGALEASVRWRPGEAARRLVEFNSPENFRLCWTKGIRERTGRGPAPGARSWEWVLQAPV